ncbi:MAG: sporulation peptidase YabG, partial [Bacilli bacterium]
DYMFQVGDLVTRKSYDNDIVFKIIKIEENNFILKGLFVRLFADSPKDDLKIYNDKENDDFLPEIDGYRNLERNEYFYLPGRILHIDADRDYLNKCMSFYKKNRLKAFGIFSKEEDLIKSVEDNLKKYNPDILVITGHDAFYRKKRKDSNYKNTDKFINAVKVARKYENSHEKLAIIAGACQSNYEELIKAGANFASSPKRINIHALDPAIIASCLAFSDKNNNIDLIKILDKTKYGPDGIGGIITKGTMYIGYPR